MSSQNSSGIEPELYRKTIYILLAHGCCQNINNLRSLFIDARIYQWRTKIPTYPENEQALARALIYVLHNQFNTQGQSALILFLQVLDDSLAIQSQLKQELNQLLKQLLASPYLSKKIQKGLQPTNQKSAHLKSSWTFQAREIVSAVDIDYLGEQVVVGTLGNQIINLNQHGQPKWTRTTGNQAWRIGISQDGEHIAVSTGNTRPLQPDRGLYYFTNEGQLVWFKDLRASSWAFAFSNDGKTIVVGTDKKRTIAIDHNGDLLWEKKVKTLGIGLYIWATALSADGHVILSGSKDHILRIFNRAGSLLATHQAEAPIPATSVSDDGSVLGAGDRAGNVYILDGNYRLLWKTTLADGIWRVKMSTDGQRIVVGADPNEGHINMFDLSGRLLWRRFVDGSASCIAVSHNKRTIVGTKTGSIHIFDEDGTILHTTTAKGKIRSVAISASGNLAVAGSIDHLVYGFKFSV